jgi:hypothetical protein
MNEELDPLEMELADLRPQPMSRDLERRIAERLGGATSSRRWVRAAVLVGALAAAALAAILFWNGSEPAVEPEDTGGHVVQVPSRTDDSLPSLEVYRRFLIGPPEDLDALLDRHAGRAQPRPSTPVYAFAHANREPQAWIGGP